MRWLLASGVASAVSMMLLEKQNKSLESHYIYHSIPNRRLNSPPTLCAVYAATKLMFRYHAHDLACMYSEPTVTAIFKVVSLDQKYNQNL